MLAATVAAVQRHWATGWWMVNLVDFQEVPHEKQRWGGMRNGIGSTSLILAIDSFDQPGWLLRKLNRPIGLRVAHGRAYW